MRIERTLRPFFTFNHSAPHGVDHDERLNKVQGEISTKNGRVIFDDDIITQHPDFIRLRCRLEPVFYNQSVMGTYTYGGKRCAPCELYSKDSKPLSSINIVYDGHGAWMDSKTGSEHLFKGRCILDAHMNLPDILFMKTFLVVEHPLHLAASLENKGTVFGHAKSLLGDAYSGGEALSFYRPLWGYGGAFRSQIPLSQIVQYYVTLDSQHNVTTCPLFSQSYMREQGATLMFYQPTQTPRTGKVILVPPPTLGKSEDKIPSIPNFYDQTLEEDIIQGRVRFSLGDTAYQEEGHPSTYHSIKGQQLGLSPYIEITFQRKI